MTVDPKARSERLLSLTESWFPFTIDPKAVTTEELALCGFVRCRRLLHGMVLVHEAPDLAGVFARAIYETYLSALFLLLGDDIAYERLAANDAYELRRMAKRFLETSDPGDPTQAKLRKQSEDALAAPEPTGKRIDTAALGREVRKLLIDAGDPNAEWPVRMYAALFGPESYTSAHGGLGAIKQYILENGQVVPRISADPWNHAGNDHRLDLMTAALLGIAYKIGTTVGLPVEGLNELAREWREEEGWP